MKTFGETLGKIHRRVWLTAIALYLFSQLFFLINIQFPRGHNFDEFHYVPSAKQFLLLTENQNWEHPPLGKMLMAASISVWGDRPIGWRFMSTIFGALTLVGMYFWALALFRREKTALFVALLTLTNQLLYVQARIGMLDTFMMTFMVWALAAFSALWNAKIERRTALRLMTFSGVMLGLACACKWTSIVAWGLCLGLVGGIRLFQSMGVVFAGKRTFQDEFPDHEDWYSPELWRGIGFKDWALRLGVLPLVVYFMTFLPFLLIHRQPAYTLWDLVLMQPKMWSGQLRVVSSHPYMSQWWQWPLMNRPIWYAFDKEGGAQEWVRGVLLLGNPWVMWGGLMALFVCAWAWLKERSRAGFLIFSTYCAFLFCWMVIPRKIAFYYYYYPAGMVLSLAIGFVIHLWESPKHRRSPWMQWVILGACLGMFFYFFPILSALKIPASSFRKWMWFSRWI